MRGGIGGLAAALSLHRAGFGVHVYEQAHSVSEVGAGIQVSPNTTRVLHGLGDDPVTAKDPGDGAFRPCRCVIETRGGRVK
jgi:2-polyprenyl-6-methoxyphenol hydroxylase-like FAD-dependent oxidoreductase